MKKCAISIILALFFWISACQSEDDCTSADRVPWLQYFAFTDVDGNDFFQNNSQYYTVKIFYPPNPVSPTSRISSFEDTLVNEGLRIYGFEASTLSEIYFSFENGDIDTLSKVWKPRSVKSLANTNISCLDRMDFYYNGELVETWDFLQNPQLRRDILNRNSTSAVLPNDRDPIYLSLPKRPSLEELD